MSTESSGSGQQSDSEIGRPRLLQRVHEAIRVRYYSRRTEEAYVHWIKRYIIINGKRHPETIGEAEVYTHVLNKSGRGVKSPLDRLEQPGARYAALAPPA
jgi:hypothetical protein